eukprot:6492231-Amphidinium_carterae.2
MSTQCPLLELPLCHVSTSMLEPFASDFALSFQIGVNKKCSPHQVDKPCKRVTSAPLSAAVVEAEPVAMTP